jgi:hypothetical protein
MSAASKNISSCHPTYTDADKSLARPGRKQATVTEDFDFSYILFIIIIGEILVLFIYIYITRLASKEIFSLSKKIHLEVGRAKDLPIFLYILSYASTLKIS